MIFYFIFKSFNICINQFIVIIFIIILFQNTLVLQYSDEMICNMNFKIIYVGELTKTYNIANTTLYINHTMKYTKYSTKYKQSITCTY